MIRCLFHDSCGEGVWQKLLEIFRVFALVILLLILHHQTNLSGGHVIKSSAKITDQVFFSPPKLIGCFPSWIKTHVFTLIGRLLLNYCIIIVITTEPLFLSVFRM